MGRYAPIVWRDRRKLLRAPWLVLLQGLRGFAASWVMDGSEPDGMGRHLLLPALVVFGMAASTMPSAAFWPRSQWRLCSEGPTAAEYQRWRCWELDGYGGEIGPGYGGVGPAEQWGKRPMRRGGAVSRLG